VLRFSVPVGVVIGVAAFVGYTVIRATDSTAGVDGGRTVATLVVLICALWTLLVLARPLVGWKIALVGGMVLIIAIIVSVPAFATSIFLLQPTATRVLTAVVIGVIGAALVEAAYRGVALAARRRRQPS
jgi:cation-transporting ATPase E